MPRCHRAGRARSLPVRLSLTFALLFVPFIQGSARAASWGSTQHGGRATAQAGAFVARADDPSAVTYNPAGIARLDGFQLQLGADAQSLDAKARGGSDRFELDDSTDVLPAAYLTYRLPGRADRVVLGLGVDSPLWTSLQWTARGSNLFEATFETDAELWQIHPVVAFRLTDRWSLGGGLRYVTGDLKYGIHEIANGGPAADNTIPLEIALRADGSDSDIGFDLGLQYAAPRWGWGAVYRQGVSLTSDDTGRLSFDVPGLPDLPIQLEQPTFRQTIELPDQAVVGGWLAPRPALRLELDVAYAGSSTSRTLVRNQPNLLGPPSEELSPLALDDRDEAWSVRLGGEGDLGAHWQLSAGLAWEQSPTPNGDASFQAPWGDAIVYSVGTSYRLPSVTFDAGYSYWDHDDLDSRFVLDGAPVTNGTFGSSEQILSVSARWHF